MYQVAAPAMIVATAKTSMVASPAQPVGRSARHTNGAATAMIQAREISAAATMRLSVSWSFSSVFRGRLQGR
jgi:hypothetical protein